MYIDEVHVDVHAHKNLYTHKLLRWSKRLHTTQYTVKLLLAMVTRIASLTTVQTGTVQLVNHAICKRMREFKHRANYTNVSCNGVYNT